MKTVSRTIGRCLTERKLSDFDQVVEKYSNFIRASQFAKQVDHMADVAGDMQLTHTAQLGIGTILYGVNEDGSLTWLGEIIDSSD